MKITTSTEEAVITISVQSDGHGVRLVQGTCSMGQVCPDCHGWGYIDTDGGPEFCHRCNGQG